MPTPLGRKVRELRKAKGLTLDGLAKATGSSKSYVWEVENNDVARPSAEKLNRFAAVLEVTPEFLTDDARSEPESRDVDTAFFRKYERMPEGTKEKIRNILDVLDKD